MAEQEALYDLIESEYKEFVQCQEAIGESILEAQSLDLDARTIARMEVLSADSNTASRFTSPVYLDVVDVKTLRKPFTTQETVNFIRNQLGLPEVSESFFLPRVREEMDQVAEQVLKTRIQDLKLATEDYRSRYLFKIEPRKGEEEEEVQLRTGKAISKFNEKLDRQLRHVEQTLESFPLGTPVRIVTANESIFYGVTARIWNTDPQGNPTAPGNWKMQFLLADPAKEMTIPLSKVNTHTGNAISVSVQERDFFGEPVYEVFDQRQQKNRQERQIFTGNTLRAMEKFNGKMINYTNQQGKTCQGVLTPQGFDIERALEHQPIPITDPMNVMKFLFEVTNRTGQLKTPDEVLVVRAQRKKDGNGLLLQVPKAKDAGGQYFLNQGLMSAAGGGEFFSVGKEMTLIVPPERIESVIQFLNTHGLPLAAFDQRQKARDLMGIALPEMELVEQGQFEAQADYLPYVQPVDAQVIASLEASFQSEPEVLGTEPVTPIPEFPEPEAPIAPAGESTPLEASLQSEPEVLETEPIAPIPEFPELEAPIASPEASPAASNSSESTTASSVNEIILQPEPIAPSPEPPQTPWMTVFPHLPQELKDVLGLPQIRKILSHPDPIALIQTLQADQPLFTDAYQHLADLYTALHPTHTLQDTPMRDTMPVAATSPDTSPTAPLDHTPLGDMLTQLPIEQSETAHPQTSSHHLIKGLQLLPESWALTPVDANKASYRNGWQTEPPLSRDELIAEINAGARGYGLRTGPISGGIVAIDLDGPSAHAKLLELSGGQELPETIAFTSGRTGRSQHLFQVPKEIWPLIKTRKIATGTLGDDGKEEHVELRWQGLQSVLPPSAHPTTRQYQWLRSPQDTEIALVPGWVIERMLVEAKTLTLEPEKRISQPSSHPHQNHWSDRDWALSYLESLHPHRADDRDTWLKIGMSLHSVDRSLLAEWDRWSTQSSKYKPGECEYVWNRFHEEKGITIATLGGWAKEDGWQSPFESHPEPNTKPARNIDPVHAYQQQVDQHDSQTGDWLAVPAQQPEHYSPSLREFKHWYFDARETGRQQKYLDRIQELAEDFKAKTPASATNPNFRNPDVTLSPPALAHMKLDATNYQTAIEQFARDAQTILKHKGADKVVNGERVREYHSRVQDYTLHYRYPTKEFTVHKAGKPLFHQSGNQVQLNQRKLHQEDFQLFGKEATRLRERVQAQEPIAATQQTSTEQSREGTVRVKQSVEMG